MELLSVSEYNDLLIERSIMPLQDVEKAYIAGIIDGEGYLGIGKANQHNWRIRIRITNTNLDLINWLKSRCSGNSWILHKAGSRGNNKQSYVIEWAALQAENLLNEVYPYLVIKKKQANVLIRFQSNKWTQDRLGLDNKIINFREGLLLEIHKLNKKGVEYAPTF